MRKPGILVCCLITVFVLSPLAQAKTFKIATAAPEGTTWMKQIRQGAELIQKKTSGRVKFKFYTGGVMGSDKSVLKKMRIGQLHGGAITGGGLSDIYPDIQIYSLPFLFHTHAEVDYVRKSMDDLLKQGMQKKGLRILGISEGGFAYFMSRTKVRKVEDLSGLKNWLPEGDDITRTIYETVGISPVPLPLSDVYTGLQTGLIDTIGSNPTGAIAFQWHTKVKYATDIPLMYLIGVLVIDDKAFQKISPEDQATVTDVMADVFRKLDSLNRQDNINARRALEQQGIEFVKISEDEERRWHSFAEKSRQSLKAQNLYTEEMFKVLESLLKEYREKNLTDAR
jgi:TRAP-type C4-dicarboxylate transport system substrate-binding protein